MTERLCYGRSGRQMRIIDSYCPDCGQRFDMFAIHSHDNADGALVETPIPALVDINCWQTSSEEPCQCGGRILVAFEPTS